MIVPSPIIWDRIWVIWTRPCALTHKREAGQDTAVPQHSPPRQVVSVSEDGAGIKKIRPTSLLNMLKAAGMKVRRAAHCGPRRCAHVCMQTNTKTMKAEEDGCAPLALPSGQ